MSRDISPMLVGWDFHPHELNVRIIEGDNGKECLQMRIDLGLLQMTLDGRPDGTRPHGFDSLLEFHEHESAKRGDKYRLDPESIEELFREAWQYYHRYLCLFHLANYELVVRDTMRNLRLFAFIKKHCKKRRDQWRFDQSRPFVIMMMTRAKAMLALARGDRPAAISEIEEGIQLIEAFLVEYDKIDQKGEFFEFDFLTRWRAELRVEDLGRDDQFPDGDGIDALRSYLQKAVDREDYEFAAMIRDKIKRLGLEENAGES